MADRLPGRTIVEAPTLPVYPSTFLSELDKLGWLHDAPEGSHLQNGVTWEERGTEPNELVAYNEGEFTSEDKNPDHELSYTQNGFAFEAFRLVNLGLGARSVEEQDALAQKRFEAFESQLVASEVYGNILSSADSAATGTFAPVDAASILLALGPGDNTAPVIFSARGPELKLRKNEVLDKAGVPYIVDQGFGGSDAPDQGEAKLYSLGVVQVWRTPAVIHPVLDAPVNEVWALVERSYYVAWEGDPLQIDVRYAEALS